MEVERAERLRVLLQRDLDWDYLLGLASRHGVLPLLYRHLNTICPEAVPKATIDELRTRFRVNAQHNLFLTAELLKLLHLFEAHGIPAIPYKGPSLAALAYGNVALRYFDDLDILVHKRDILRAKALLISQGYRPWCQLTEAQEAAHLQSFHAYTFRRDDGRGSIDLHWRFAPSHFPFPLDLERLWECSEPVSFAGTMVLSIPVEDLLLILCMHGAKDGWTRLIWICDIAELIRVHRGMDWKRIMEQAGRLHNKRRLLLGLLLAHNLLEATLQENILHRAQGSPEVKSLAAQVHMRLFSESDIMTSVVERIAFHLRVMDRLRDRVPYLLDCLCQMLNPNSADQMLLTLPARLSFLYYILRPIRLVGTYGPGLWKLKHRFPHR
jgi:hypothetical protein